MPQTQNGRPGKGAHSETTTDLAPQSIGGTDIPWWAGVDWWASPATAYARGLEDGLRLGEERLTAVLTDVLSAALGESNVRDGIAALIHYRDQLAARGVAPW